VARRALSAAGLGVGYDRPMAPSNRSTLCVALLLTVACDVRPSAEDTAPKGPPPLRFVFPVDAPDLITQTIGVDHDPAVYDGVEELICTNYDGRSFPWCYDEHDGSDYLLDGGFDTMDAGSAGVIAAADGVVVEISDGHYDRCHGVSSGGVDCDGHEMIANYVVLEHEGGVLSRYWHLQSGSVLVAVGQAVRCGAPLGRIGSSGYSSTPHLHFEVHDPDGLSIDPYAGAHSQAESLWVEQGDPEGLPGGACEG
jgi:hypothetical protein